MNIPEFIELMRHKSQLKPREDLTSVTSQTNSYVKSDSRTNSECQHINIVFFTEEKLTANVKRRYETQVCIVSFSMFNHFNYLFLINLRRFQMQYQKHYRSYHQKYVLKY